MRGNGVSACRNSALETGKLKGLKTDDMGAIYDRLNAMMKVLEQAIEKIKTLPEERQEAAAEALELIAAQVTDDALSAGEIAGVHQAQDAVRRGEVASEVKVAEFFGRFRS